jgi:hypothetical protein
MAEENETNENESEQEEEFGGLDFGTGLDFNPAEIAGFYGNIRKNSTKINIFNGW